MSIHNAALEGQFGLVKQFIEQDKNAITAKDEDERHALHWAGMDCTVNFSFGPTRKIHAQIQQERWSKENLLSLHQNTPSFMILIIVSGKHLDITEYLLGLGALVNAQDEVGRGLMLSKEIDVLCAET